MDVCAFKSLIIGFADIDIGYFGRFFNVMCSPSILVHKLSGQLSFVADIKSTSLLVFCLYHLAPELQIIELSAEGSAAMPLLILLLLIPL